MTATGGIRAATDPADLGVREAAALLQGRALSATELTEACLARIEARNGGVPTFAGAPDAVNAWVRVYPELAGIHLVDYKVRILDGRAATSAVTRVMLTSADADGEWTTVGVSDDIVTASWEALTDGVAFGLLRAGAEPLADEPEISQAV